jgi:hypothetical protein
MLLWGACRGREPAVPPMQPSPPQTRTTIEVVPDLGRDRLVYLVDSAAGLDRVIAGSLRAELTPHEVRFADDQFAVSIIRVARVQRGWLFLAADGAVARADSFLGPLQPLGHVPRPRPDAAIFPLSALAGRLAFAAPDPHASRWTPDGTAPIALARGAPPGTITSAAFTDADHGMIVVTGGELFVTRDGAASFQRVDLGDAAAAGVVLADGKLHVHTSSGRVVFDRDGVRAGSSTEGPMPASDPKLAARVHAAALRRYGALVAELFGGVVTDRGDVLVPNRETLGDLAGPPSTAELDALERRDCTAARWGAAVAVFCGAGPPVRVDPTMQRSTPMGKYALDPANVVLSADGTHAAWPCGGDQPAQQRLCALVDGKVIEHPAERGSLIGMHGDALVVRRTARSPNTYEIALLDATTGRDRQVLSVSVPTAAGLSGESWQLSADGAAVIGTVHESGAAGDPRSETWLLHVALADQAVTTVRLPDGATRAGFITAGRGVATGQDAAKLWLTDDGGAHWQAGDAPVQGPLLWRPPWPPAPFPSLPGPVRCSGRRCVLDSRVVVSFDRSASPPAVRVLAAPPDSAAPAVGPDQISDTALACTLQGAARRVAVRGYPGHELDAKGRLQILNAHADVTLQVTARGRWDVTWHGHDWRGRYPSLRAAGALPTLAPDLDEYALERTTREGAVIYHLSSHHRLVWLPAGGRPSVILDERPEFPELEDLLALPDGTLAVLIRIAENPHTATYRRLFLVGRDGKTIARREFYWEDPDARKPGSGAGIGIIDGAVGVQWSAGPTDARWFFPIRAAAGNREIAPLDLVAVPICAPRPPTPERARPPGDISIHVTNMRLDTAPDSMEYDIQRVYLRDGSPVCLEAIETAGRRDRGGVFAAAASDGSLRGELYERDADGARSQSIRCTAK